MMQMNKVFEKAGFVLKVGGALITAGLLLSGCGDNQSYLSSSTTSCPSYSSNKDVHVQGMMCREASFSSSRPLSDDVNVTILLLYLNDNSQSGANTSNALLTSVPPVQSNRCDRGGGKPIMTKQQEFHYLGMVKSFCAKHPRKMVIEAAVSAKL